MPFTAHSAQEEIVGRPASVKGEAAKSVAPDNSGVKERERAEPAPAAEEVIANPMVVAETTGHASAMGDCQVREEQTITAAIGCAKVDIGPLGGLESESTNQADEEIDLKVLPFLRYFITYKKINAHSQKWPLAPYFLQMRKQ